MRINGFEIQRNELRKLVEPRVFLRFGNSSQQLVVRKKKKNIGN